MEATTTLADALLEDLDDLSDNFETEDDDDDDNDTNIQVDTTSKSSEPLSSKINQQLLDDVSFMKHVQTISRIMGENIDNTTDETVVQSSSMLVAPETTVAGHEETMDYHQLMVKSNQYLLLISNDLSNSHFQLCEVYKIKFPELEELIPDIIQYVQVVRCIDNAIDITTKSINDSLNQYLSNQQIITLSVAYSTTNGRLLTSSELEQVHTITAAMEQVLSIRQLFMKYIEQRMESTVPNMYALIGPTISAQFLSITGNLAALSKIPACNLQVLGQIKQRRGGVGGAPSSSVRHTGILAQTDMVQSCPKHLQMKVIKMVASKLALAIRCDYAQSDIRGQTDRNGSSGRTFRHQIEKKIQHLQEPDKAPVLKALPK
jgi:U4/U6 small nuclear ribonucleoprotein PRP31